MTSFNAGNAVAGTDYWPAGISPTDRAVLCVAHPGHELRVWGWLTRVRPLVCVLTDGSGGSAQSRLHYTQQLIARAGAPAGAVFGATTDRQLYAHALEGRLDWFCQLADWLAGAWRTAGARYAICDAAEGYSSGHEICRLLAGYAAAKCGVRLLELPLMAAPSACLPELRGESVWLWLSDRELEHKLAEAAAYAPLAAEIAAALASNGREAFRRELLRATRPAANWEALLPADPYYEVYGRQQIANGVYTRLLTRAEHLAPLARHLQSRLRRAA